MDSTAGAGPSNSSSSLWTDILSSANRQKSVPRKNVMVLSEPRHGRRYLLGQLLCREISSRRSGEVGNELEAAGLALGYDLMDLKEEGDEDTLPPLSIFYPPSSHPSLLKLLPLSLPAKSLLDTAVVIVLDWTKPSNMITELLKWLAWVEEWATKTAKRGEPEEGKERLQSHLQHYVEPAPPPPPNPNASPSKQGNVPLPLASISTRGYANLSTLLPLGPGSLTRNICGIPIIVVCTRADQIDSVGEDLGMKGGIAGAGKGWGWEERTDWVQQVLRTICLSYGASLFYTAPTEPKSYALLKSHLLHRLYTVPPPLHAPSSATDSEQAAATQPTASSSSRFPFLHRANVHDRDALMVPAGWDSWGKINVLRDGFDPSRVDRAWQASLDRFNGEEAEDEAGIEDLWLEVIPDTDRGGEPIHLAAVPTTAEDDQAFLAKQLDILLKDPQRDPRASFRTSAAVSHNQEGAAGIVGPMAGTGLSLPSVEIAMKEMEGGNTDDLKERFARLARRESKAPGVTSPPAVPSGTPGAAAPVANEVLRDFFQGLLATRSQGGRKSVAPGETATTDGKK